MARSAARRKSLPPKTQNNIVRLDREAGYRFRTRDADMDWICAAIDRSGLSSYRISLKVTEESRSAAYVAPTTIDRWLDGKTARPQNFTLTWVAYALGYEREWKPIARA